MNEKKIETKIVLKNTKGEIVRVFADISQRFSVVFRKDIHRIEICENLDEFNENCIPFEELAVLTSDDLKKQPFAVSDQFHLELASDQEVVAVESELPPEPEGVFSEKLRKSAFVHLLLLALILSIGFTYQYFFSDEVEPQTVTIFKQDLDLNKVKKIEEKKKIVTQTVKPSKKKKIVYKKNQKKKQVVSKKVRSPKVVKKKQDRKRHIVSSNKRTNKKAGNPTTINKKGPIGFGNKQNLDQAGVLGILDRGTGKGQGVNLRAVKNDAGVGGGSSGSGYGSGFGSGGTGAPFAGKGMVAMASGAGSKARGAGGLGTRGRAGGQSGYGEISMSGGDIKGRSIPLTEEVDVEGGLTEDQIAAVVMRNMGQIVYCYEKGLQSKPSLQGRVTTYFKIDNRGRVQLAKVTRSNVESKQVESCMVNKIKTWKFPRPSGGVNVSVNYPFELRRVSLR